MNDKKKKSTRKSKKYILRRLLLYFILIFVFSLGFIPLILAGHILSFFVSFTKIWHFYLLPFLIPIGIGVLLFYQLLFTSLFINIFNIKYQPGVYDYGDKNSFKWIIVCMLYTPLRKIIGIIPVGGLQNTYLRLLGMKIGENSLVGGSIMDPCVTEFGDNVTMGRYAVIYGHIQDLEKGIIMVDRVKIGNNCVIGAGAIIMPGAVLEDDVKLAAGAVVTKGQVLKKGKIYAGVPAKEIKSKKK